MSFKLAVVPHERTRGLGCNPVTSWKFKITTGSRCKGLESAASYSSRVLALNAGERMLDKLVNTIR